MKFLRANQFKKTLFLLAVVLVCPASDADTAFARDKEIDAQPVGLKLRRRQRLEEREARKKTEMEKEEEANAMSEPYKSYPANPRTYSLKLENPSKDQVLNVVEQAIAATEKRYLVAGAHTPWQIFHGILAGRKELQVRVGNKYMSAIDWLSTANPVYQGKHLFEVTPYGGRTHEYVEPYLFEGHPNQFLGILTMSNLPRTHSFVANTGQKITIDDIINNAKMTVNDREEVTWTLWFLSHYLEPDAEWTNAAGEYWSIEKLVRIETQASVRNAACGGTHKLFALAFARNNYMRRSGKPLRGVWIEADQKVKRYIAESKAIQRSDGSFPTKYFQGYGAPEDFEDRIKSSGHMMEWLMISVTDEELRQPWIRRGIYHVAYQILANRRVAADTGPLYHALDSLILFRDRMKLAPSDGDTPKPIEQLAKPESKSVPEKTRTALKNIFKGISASPDVIIVDEGSASEEFLPPIETEVIVESVPAADVTTKVMTKKEARKEEKTAEKEQKRELKKTDGWRKAKKIYEFAPEPALPEPAPKTAKENFEMPII